eukprot:gene11414-12757_t
MFNVDAVSCVIGESTSAKVRLVRGSNEYLKQVNRSPSKTVKQEKRRAVKQLYVTSADGYLNCAIIVLKDSHIKELKLIPIDKHHSGGYQLWLLLVPYQPKKRKNTQTVQNENATANNTISSSSVDDQQEATIENQVEEDCDLFSLLLEEEADIALLQEDHRGVEEVVATESASNDVKMMEDIFCQVILPVMEQKREEADYANSLLSMMVEENSNTPSNDRDDIDDDGDQKTLEDMLLLYDGDYPQIEATFTKVIPTIEHNSIELQKLPGGGSLQFQPNDLMRAHNIIHNYVNSSQYHTEDLFPDPPYLAYIEKLLGKTYKVEKSSVKSYCNFFRQLPTILSKAFSVHNVQQGWRSCISQNR